MYMYYGRVPPAGVSRVCRLPGWGWRERARSLWVGLPMRRAMRTFACRKQNPTEFHSWLVLNISEINFRKVLAAP